MATMLSREVPVEPRQTALLFIDVQNYTTSWEGGEFKDKPPAERAAYDYYFDRLATVALPNMKRVQDACRRARIEVMYTVIEALTRDMRDLSLDYKISNLGVPRGSWDAKVPQIVAVGDDEIVIPKTSSSVFISTNIDYVLRSLGMRQLIVVGVVTDQCVESAVRDACDLGYLVTLVTDACATATKDRHDNSLRAIKGYCRQRTTDEFLREIAASA
jgi:ureidoacrylate peracid hydrolase